MDENKRIYTDKNYLDSQFLNITLRFDNMERKFDERMDGQDARMTSHDFWHRRWGKRAIEIAGAAVAIVTALNVFKNQ